jgi:hypothetical protein
MPYFTAKTVMIFLNIVSYLSAITIILKLENVSDRQIGWGLGVACLWLPFIATMMQAQVNGIILVLVAGAVLAVTRGFPYLCGALFALAALFKLFPLAAALVLGLRNWRILAGFSAVFGASFLIPGASKWIVTIMNWGETEAPLYVWLGTISPVLVYACPILIGIVTASVAVRAKDNDYPLLTAYAIPAVFLAMPRLGYYHLTLLAFTFVHLFSSGKNENRLLTGFLILSAAILGFPRPGSLSPFVFDPVTPLMYFAMFSLWVVLGIRISHRPHSPSSAG